MVDLVECEEAAIRITHAQTEKGKKNIKNFFICLLSGPPLCTDRDIFFFFGARTICAVAQVIGSQVQEPEAVSGRKRHSVGQRFGGSRHVVIYSCPKPYPEAIRRWRPAIVWGIWRQWHLHE